MNIKDLMTDSLSKVGEFEAACNDMINSRYILAESKIIKILQTVALSKILQSIIGGALKGFNYVAAASEWSDGEISLPTSEKDNVALTFCILADIDNRKIYLNDFLRKFFWDGDINTAYASFCATLIEPFKNYVVGALSQAHTNNEEEPEPRIEQSKPIFDQNTPILDQSNNTFQNDAPQFDAPQFEYSGFQYEAPKYERDEMPNFERKAMNLADAIERYIGFSQNEKDEFIFMCDNIASKARSDIAGARAIALGLKKLVGNVPEILPFISDITDELGC